MIAGTGVFAQTQTCSLTVYMSLSCPSSTVSRTQDNVESKMLPRESSESDELRPGASFGVTGAAQILYHGKKRGLT